MKITIKEIAKQCNVSVTTVSRVINNKVENIGKKTVCKVQDKIKELNFKPNSIARSMITGKSNTIGLVIPDVRNPFFSELAKGVEDFMNDQNYGVLLCNTDGSLIKEEQYINLLQGKSVDGVIFTTQNNIESEKYFLDAIEKTPVVLVERYLKGKSNIPGVYVQNEIGAELMCNFILERGYSKIACITGPMHTTNSKLRLKGYKKALRNAGLKVDNKIIVEGNYHYESGYDLMKKLYDDQREKFDAVFACNDIMAYGAYKFLKDNNISVPDDLALAGFDNMTFFDVFEPKLTTINLPAQEMGKKASKMLFDIITNHECESNSYEFKVELVDNGSVGCK